MIIEINIEAHIKMGVKFKQDGGDGVDPISAQGLFFTGTEGIVLTPQTVTPSGGVSPYTFADGGTLPTGVSIDANTGQISGTPTQSGNILATITITDAAGNTGTAIAAFALINTVFADTFNRASGPLGSAWIVAVLAKTPFTQPVSLPDFVVGVATDLGQACIMSDVSTGNPGTSLPACAIPASVYSFAGNGQQHFAQFEFISAIANGEMGPAVGIQADFSISSTRGFYALYANTGGGNVRLIKTISGGESTIATPFAVAAAAGDVYRLAIDFSNPAQTEIYCTKNGGVPVQVTDNAANFIRGGCPGFAARGTNTTAAQQWRNFSCGLGL